MRRPALALRVRRDRARVIVVVAGELDVATVGDLDAAVRDLRADGWQDVVLDLRGVEVVGSTGLGWLLQAERDARANEWSLSLVDGSAAVTRLLALTGTRGEFRWAKGV